MAPPWMAQSGTVVLALVLLIAMLSGFFLLRSLNQRNVEAERTAQTAAALAEAKAALIAYAVSYGDVTPGKVHGYLPCPDLTGTGIGGEGGEEGTCGSKNVSSLGRLPWKSLGLPPLKDDRGECLWYAVAGPYKNNPKTDLMNWDTNGLFEVMSSDGTSYLAGSQPTNRAVAVIFAPGAPLSAAQNRTTATGTDNCGGNYTASNYLDNDTLHSINNSAVSATANAATRFVAGFVKVMQDGSEITFVNDRVVYITKDEIFNAILQRADFVDPARNPLRLMTQKTAECLAYYGTRNAAGASDKRIPWSARLAITNFNDDTSYDDIDKRMYGRASYRVNASDSDTSNAISFPQYQLQSSGANCAPVGWPTHYPWWTNWKDHVFYVVASAYRPETGSSPSCGTCLSVNGSGQYIGVIIFAGKRLSTQTRNTDDPDKHNVANYLEGVNASNFTASGSLGRTQVSGTNTDFASGLETTTFNDILYCIRPDLTVVSC